MGITFRKFMEDVGAPVMGSDTAGPSSPDDDKKYDGRVADRELGISPRNRDVVDMSGEMLRSDRPLEIPGHPELNSAPIFIQILKKYPDGSAHVRIKTSLSNPEKTMVRNPGGTPLHLQGGDDESREPELHLSRNILDKIRYGDFDSAGGGMLPPPPGGPGSGGAPSPPGGMQQ